MMSRTAMLIMGFSVFFAAPVAAQSNTPQTGACNKSVFNVWNAGGGTEVTIIDCGDNTPCGHITKLADPDLPDGNNRDSSLRTNPLIGTLMLSKFRQSRKGWKKGKIYNPANGKTYRSTLRLQPNDQLLVKGCVGPFCEKQTWHRALKPTCST